MCANIGNVGVIPGAGLEEARIDQLGGSMRLDWPNKA